LEKITSKISWPIEQPSRSAIYPRIRRAKKLVKKGGDIYIEDVEEDVELDTALTSNCMIYTTCIK